jgi:hypothetical protein
LQHVIDAVAEDAATGALAEYYRQQRAAWGFLPNYAGAFSTRPDVARAWNALNTAIRDGMDRRRSLPFSWNRCSSDGRLPTPDPPHQSTIARPWSRRSARLDHP